MAENLILIILLTPLLGAVSAALVGHKDKKSTVGIASSMAIMIPMLATLMLYFGVFEKDDNVVVHLFDWLNLGFLNIAFDFMLDSISMIMLIIVTVVSFIVHVYATWYMAHEDGYNRFFAFLNLFVFSMLMLVLSDNFLGLFVGWEGVGVCSWGLIGFFYKDSHSSWSANEAFIVNRVADLAMMIGIFLVYWNFGSLKYEVVFSQANLIQPEILSVIAIFLFLGAMGKSAQFPFHTWLADAMAGPTPVSALIHAATMVTAGVYLVIRCHDIFMLTPSVSMFIATLGTFVALFGASMALVNSDLKKIVAYSTLSQLGYMFAAAGVGAYWVALFHLFTHAFFKSLLFLCSGNVMHAMNNELNIHKMGGLFKYMRATAFLMLIGSVALVGIYPFAGFFSKEAIIGSTFAFDKELLGYVLIVAAGMTAYYSTRVFVVVFFGNGSKYDHHPHDAAPYALFVLVPLAISAMVDGFFQEEVLEYVKAVIPNSAEPHLSTHLPVILAVMISLVGILVGYFMHKDHHKLYDENKERGFFYNLLKNQYYIPQFYNLMFVENYKKISKTFAFIDVCIIDSFVDNIGKSLILFSKEGRSFQDSDISSMLRFFVVGLVVAIALVTIFSFKQL